MKTYAHTLAQYHLHLGAKFLNGDFVKQGETSRRHILATGFSFIGKEANRLEEQFYLTLSGEAVVAHGTAPDAVPELREQVAAVSPARDSTGSPRVRPYVA